MSDSQRHRFELCILIKLKISVILDVIRFKIKLFLKKSLK